MFSSGLFKPDFVGYSVPMIHELLRHLQHGRDLDSEMASAGVRSMVDPGVEAETKADFLSALATKGETRDEISAFARFLRDQSIRPPEMEVLPADEILDVCGTGGDHLNTFNVSTTVALLLASMGVTVAKHGNRAITSKSGSADVLMALGIPVDLTPQQAIQSLIENHFAFFFAIHYHPAFQHIAPARAICAQRGQRTLFNFLGPLLNPIRPGCQMIGVPRPERCETIAGVLKDLGVRRAMVISGRVDENRFMDEFSTLDNTTVAEFYHNRGIAVSELEVSYLPLSPVCLEDLMGGDSQRNSQIIEDILTGKDLGPRAELVYLNAAAALLVADRARSISDGWESVRQAILSGQTASFLEKLRSWKPA